MNKKGITAIILFLGVSASAQQGINNLIRAEQSFAAYSVAHSTKEAFEAFIDSSSIMFENDKPVKAVDYWSKREKRPGVLNWYPQVAEITPSGNFGFTTGPWTFPSQLPALGANVIDPWVSSSATLMVLASTASTFVVAAPAR